MYKMSKELVFKIKNNNYTKDKYGFQKDKKPININEVNIDKIVLSNKTPYGEYGANKYHISYLIGGLRPLHIITIKNIKLYTNHINVLTNDNKLLNYIEIWNNIGKIWKKRFHSESIYNNEHIKTKISSYNENFCGFKKPTKNEYCGHSILLLESVCEVKINIILKNFLHKFFVCKIIIECNNNKNSLFKELVQIVDWSDDDES